MALIVKLENLRYGNYCNIVDTCYELIRFQYIGWLFKIITPFSKGGRITLIKSTLLSLPIYFMSLFIIPRRLVQYISCPCGFLALSIYIVVYLSKKKRRLVQDFRRPKETFYGEVVCWRKKPHPINWTIVCLEKKVRGLGVCNLWTLNKALLGKQIWRFATTWKSFWKHIIIRKSEEEEGDGVWEGWEKDMECRDVQSHKKWVGRNKK